MGLVSTMVDGSLVLGPDKTPVRGTIARPISQRAPVTPAVWNNLVSQSGPAWGAPQPIVSPAWGAGGPSNWQNPPASFPASPSAPTGNSLAIAQALLQTNPQLLTAQQWTLLQNAGLVASTLPYSSASQVNPAIPISSAAAVPVNDPNCLAIGMTGGPYPNCTPGVAASSSIDIGAALNTDYAGMPLWAWLAAGLGAYFLFGRKGRR